MIEHAAAAISQAARTVVVVTAQNQSLPPLPKHVTIVKDAFPGRGPLVGIYSGIQSVTTDWAYVVGCDMPFVNPRLLATLVTVAGGYDAVVPRLDGKPQTLHAVYNRSCLLAIEALLTQDGVGLRDLLARINVRYLEERELDDVEKWRRSCFNVNTQADLALAGMWLARDKPKGEL